MKNRYGLDTAVITGAIDGKTTAKGLKPTLNNVLTCFSPISKDKAVLLPNNPTEIDVLIATDCISEGQNEASGSNWSIRDDIYSEGYDHILQCSA